MAEPTLQQPPPTVRIGALDDDTRKSLDAAFNTRNNPVPVDKKEPLKDAIKEDIAAATKGKIPGLPVRDAKPKDAEKPDDKAGAQTYPRSAIQWNEWKAEERKRLEQEFNERFKDRPDPSAIEAIRKERDEYAAQLQTVAIERDPRFEREFQAAVTPIIAGAQSAVGVAHADAAKKLLEMPAGESRDAAVEKLVADLPAWKQAAVGTAIAEMDRLRAMKAVKIEESRSNWQRLQTEHSAKAAAESEKRTAEMKQVLEKTIGQWQGDKGLPVLQKRDGDTEWNAKVDGAVELARNIYGGELDLDELARAALWAASAPLLLESLAAAQKELATLKGEHKAGDALSPGRGAQGGTALQPNGDDDVPQGLSYGAAIAHIARKQGVM